MLHNFVFSIIPGPYQVLSVACSAESRVWVWGYATSSHYKKNRSQESTSLAECSSLGTILVNCGYCLQKPIAGPQCVSPAACTGNLVALKLPMLNMYSGQTHCHSNRTPSTNIYIIRYKFIHDVCAKSNQNTEQLCI